MKKNLFILISFIAVTAYSCSSDDENEPITEVTLNYQVRYYINEQAFGYEGATIYTFNKFDARSDTTWKYAGNGIYKKGNKERLYDNKGITDNKGELTVSVYANTICSAVIESKDSKEIIEASSIEVGDGAWGLGTTLNPPE